MEFGKLEDISFVDWTLPEDDPKNHEKFTVWKGVEHKLYFGSPAWANKLWLGKIYPPKTSPDEFLYYYSRNFNSIELNTTHYRIPDQVTVTQWLSQVPEHFLFCPKVNKGISHERFGLADKTLLKVWIEFIQKLGTNLGPCFIQLHENFSYQDKTLLFQFLENWPSEFKLCLELRHPSWFKEGKILPALVEYLYKKKIGLVITDVAGRRDVLHTSLSAPWTMIRLIGNDESQSDERRLRDWAKRLSFWRDQGLKETFLFLHAPDDVMTIEFSQMAHRVFTEIGFQDVPSFKIQKERDLFNQNDPF